MVRPRDFFTNMSNKELLDYCFSIHGRDIYQSELQKKDSGLHHILQVRGLLGKIRCKRRSFFKMTNQDLLRYCFERYGKAITRGELAEKDGGLYRAIRERDLLESIKTSKMPNGFYKGKIDRELLKYCFETYGRNVFRHELQSKNSSLYNEIMERGLLDRIATKQKKNVRQRGSLSTMSNKELLDYCFSLYSRKITRMELRDKDSGLYESIRNRGLLSRIKYKAKKNQQPMKSFKKMSDKEVLKYCFSRYGRTVTRGFLQKNNFGLYNTLRTRHLLDRINTQVSPRGYLNQWDNFYNEFNEAIKKNNGEFPTTRKLKDLGYSSLTYALKYHGGMAAVREKIGYNQQVRIKLARQLEEIADQVAA